MKIEKKTVARCFDEFEGTKIETITDLALKLKVNTKLNSEESSIHWDVKRLYTDFPHKEAIEIAFKNIYRLSKPLERSRSTRKRLLNKAVSSVLSAGWFTT